MLPEPRGWDSALEFGTIVGQCLAGAGATENTQPWQRGEEIPWLFPSFYPAVSHKCLPLGKLSKKTADMTAWDV